MSSVENSLVLVYGHFLLQADEPLYHLRPRHLPRSAHPNVTMKKSNNNNNKKKNRKEYKEERMKDSKKNGKSMQGRYKN
jgi:hypothetical protein